MSIDLLLKVQPRSRDKRWRQHEGAANLGQRQWQWKVHGTNKNGCAQVGRAAVGTVQPNNEDGLTADTLTTGITRLCVKQASYSSFSALVWKD